MLELALVLVIFGLLALVLLTSLMDHQSETQRREVAHRMHEVAEWLRLQHARTRSYAAALPDGWSTEDAGRHYLISLPLQPVRASDPAQHFPALAADAYTLQAVPVGQDELGCGALLLDHTGRRGVTGVGATVAACWGE